MNKIVFLAALFLYSTNFLSAQVDDEIAFVKEMKKYRKDYKKALVADQLSPIEKRKDTKSMSFYEPKAEYVVKCLFIQSTGEKPFDMTTYSGDKKPYVKYGELLFELPGKGTKRINIYKSLKSMKLANYKDHLFIPFKDLTNDDTTYGGGRYLDIKTSDIQKGIVYLDFNKAYNPWCAYGNGFSCPIPPVENHLNIAIEAGELNFSSDLGKIKS